MIRFLFPRPQTSLWFAGAFLFALGLFHGCIWLITGGPWEGPVSWRKPILFGISSGLTLASLGWIHPRLRPRWWDRLACGLTAWALVLEVLLITLQQWRGRASHFNHSTWFDTVLGHTMTVLIVLVTLAIVDFTWRSFESFAGKSDVRRAVQGGLCLLLISCLIGFVILFFGEYQVQWGRDPSTFGESGVTKFPHGIAIHAIQFFPVLAWVLRGLKLDEASRAALILQSMASMSVLLVLAVYQTAWGRDRFDLGVGGLLLMLAAGVLAAPTVWQVLVRCGHLIMSDHRLSDPLSSAHPSSDDPSSKDRAS